MVMKNQKGFSAIEAVLVLIIVGLVALLGWSVWHVHKQSGSKTSSKTNTATTATASSCAYIPTQNYSQNAGLYSIWEQSAKLVNFDVYLPCHFPSDFVMQQLGVDNG